jgi:hypothetical protein
MSSSSEVTTIAAPITARWPAPITTQAGRLARKPAYAKPSHVNHPNGKRQARSQRPRGIGA